MARVRAVQKEAGDASVAAQAGDFAPAKTFIWKHKGLAASVLLPLGIILRFPGLIGMALRVLGLVAAATLQNPAMREMFARWTWIQCRAQLPLQYCLSGCCQNDDAIDTSLALVWLPCLLQRFGGVVSEE